MLRLAKILSLLPFTVNVFGKKRNMIVRVGDFFYSSNRLKKVKIDSETVDLSESEYFKIWAYATKNLERDFLRSDLGNYMTLNLKPKDVFVDIGANLGGYSRLAKKLGLEVHLFEPVPSLSSVLFENEHFFGKCYPIALSDQSGVLPFHMSSENIGGSSLVESNDDNNSGYDDKTQVVVETFDFVFNQKINSKATFDLIKIDVEGNEFSVVKGMEKALEQNLVRAIWCEVRGMTSDRNPGSYLNVSKYLSQYGFTAYTCNGNQKTPYDYLNAQNVPQFFDLLYLRDE